MSKDVDNCFPKPKMTLHLWHLADAFVQNDLQRFLHIFLLWWSWLPCRYMLTSTSGAVWDSASCPRTLRQADQRYRTSDLPITRRWLCPRATAAHLLKGLVLSTTKRYPVYSHRWVKQTRPHSHLRGWNQRILTWINLFRKLLSVYEFNSCQ